MLRLLLIAAVALLPFASFAADENGRIIVQGNGTITVGGTFQSVLNANFNRLQCVIHNSGTGTMYVWYGSTGSATTSNGQPVAVGQEFYCASAGGVMQGAITITGTTNDPFMYSETSR